MLKFNNLTDRCITCGESPVIDNGKIGDGECKLATMYSIGSGTTELSDELKLEILLLRFTSWMEACATKFGFADLEQVNHWPPQLSDKQESFVLAET
jgi:hypothetical protein